MVEALVLAGVTAVLVPFVLVLVVRDGIHQTEFWRSHTFLRMMRILQHESAAVQKELNNFVSLLGELSRQMSALRRGIDGRRASE